MLQVLYTTSHIHPLKQRFIYLTSTAPANLDSPINLIWMSLECARKLEVTVLTTSPPGCRRSREAGKCLRDTMDNIALSYCLLFDANFPQ